MKYFVGCILSLAAILFLSSFIVALFIAITEAIGRFLFSIFGVEYSSFCIWLLLIFSFLSILFFYASRESYRDYIVKLKVYKIFQKILGED